MIMEEERKEAPKVSQEKLDKAIREYLERMIKIHETKQGISTDDQIDCPQCGRLRAIVFRDGDWYCLWEGCKYNLPQESCPIGLNGFKEMIRLNNMMDFVNKWKHLWKHLL